jgi:hypothetical protein
MAARNKVLRRIALALGVVALVCVAGWIYVVRSFRIGLSPAALEPLGTILKKTGADILVVKQKADSQSRATPPRGYLVAYEQNPESFKSDARLFDTWLTATQLATAVLDNGPSGDWVESSSAIEYVKPESRLDPWGHSLCLLRRGDVLLVISGGPDALGSPTCRNIRMTAEELSKFPPKKLLQSPSGSLILVAQKTPSARVMQSSK